MRKLAIALLTAVIASNAIAQAPASQPEKVQPAGIKAVFRNGQTFITWIDAAEGEAGAGLRYSLYRSEQPITQDNLDKAQLCYHGVMNNSAKLIGHAYFMKSRLDPSKPTCIIETGGKPLPMWSGIAVHTATAEGKAYYAVVATDTKFSRLSEVVPGESATTEPVNEKVEPTQPIRQDNPGKPGGGAPSDKTGLPLTISLHGSSSSGPSMRGYGVPYLYFATRDMGWRDGLQGVFTVAQNPAAAGGQLVLSPIDAIENPSGNGVSETCWFGYLCRPQGATHDQPRVYPFTERRVAWMLKWVMETYQVDPLRVYSAGQSMGGMASTQFSFRHPEIFAAVYPRLQRVRQSWLPNITGEKGATKDAVLEDGVTNYFVHMDSVKWVSEQHGDLPFYGWCCGRTDWVEPWKAYIEMVQALTANHHGFAMAWTNGGHDNETPKCMVHVNKYYPSSKFALNQSYPAFGNSSINDDMGSGELVEKEVGGKKVKVLKDGALTGGINLGFIWSDVVDEPDKWAVKLSNDLCKDGPMTVDVTPRRCQKFKPKAGDKFKWTNSAGGTGQVAADQWGLVTVEKVVIKPGEPTLLTIVRE